MKTSLLTIGIIAISLVALLYPLDSTCEEKKDPNFDEAYALERLKAAIAGKEKEPSETVLSKHPGIERHARGTASWSNENWIRKVLRGRLHLLPQSDSLGIG